MAYNWIGPRGPLPNIEIPNILNLADVSIGGNLTSNRIWIEGLWHIFRDYFDLSPTANIQESDTFIYPLTLHWRVNFDAYFTIGDGILEYAHPSNDILHSIKQGNGYILIDHSPEAFVYDKHLNVIHSYFLAHGIPLYKILYLTGCMNTEEVYNNYCIRHQIPNDPRYRLKLVSYPCSIDSASRDIENLESEPFYDSTLVPKKLFLSWNRRHKAHRNMLALLFDKNDLLNYSYFSMSKEEPEFPDRKFEDIFEDKWLEMFNLTRGDVIDLVKKLPLVVDGETVITKMMKGTQSTSENFYENSLVSIITETNFLENEISMTEKSIKPVKEKHPFIMIGVKGTLKAYHNLGYKTFSNFWSEEYDNIEDSWERLREIIRVCKEISKWDSEKILEFKKKVKPILDYNFQVAKGGISKSAANNIIEHITRHKC
jgi:hypothetical protein